MILTAYLDESGTHDESPITVMGGVLASARQWERFESEFREIKKKYSFKIFHTKKFKKKSGDFAGWSNDQCLSLIYELGSLTSDAFTEGVTIALDNTTYENEYKAGEKPSKLRLDSKYGLCFRQCLLFFILEGEKRKYKNKYPKLHFILESGHQNAGDAIRIFNEVNEDLKKLDCDMLGYLTFADKDKCDPLMMADFIAHTTFTSTVRASKGRPSLKPNPVPPNQTGITHLKFSPGGLADVKAQLVAKFGPTRPKSSASS